ncbi:nuclear transport factor 2 family protein [Flavisolibacter tropicus]|uniref:DUF4440 domain-containing protein n=1 Tax=Flavisolibacter tropicus TaxID=1492898 RepID=A0A172U087_9BACT|nr:nuclear transport factor 2 family protein [Flavisolibacter tropicus]ANE52765.1 hypothetical protein SY85_22095 [Flavisolibacter tropicus]
MKRLLFINAVLVSLLGRAQTVNNKGNTKPEIRMLMNDWMVATMKKDVTTLNKIMAPEYKLYDIYPFDKAPATRETWMTNAIQHLKIDSVHYYTMKVDVIDNTAIVQSKFYWAGSFYGQPFADSASILVDTWMKRKQGWQVVNRLRVDKPE